VPRVGNLVGGRYELLAEIGQGAMGTVWKAVHTTLRRPFAIKFLKAYDADATLVQERFSREARLAAAVCHRFVVDIVDHGMTDEGTSYLVMAYLEGEALDARLRRDPALRVRQLLRLMGEVLLGLGAVHRAGIVHRDVKPENILLTLEDDEVVPKLVDFSISREEPGPGPARARPTPLTRPGSAMGTPWYMSPEQADGRSPIDRRSDIFSMGVILYEALTGTPPFDGSDLESVVAAVAQGVALPLNVMRADLGDELCSIVETAMAREPDRRYQAAEVMAAALFAAMANVPDDLTCPRSQTAMVVEATIRAPEPAASVDAPAVERGPAGSRGKRRARMLSSRAIRTFASVGALVLLTAGAYVSRPHGRAKQRTASAVPALETPPDLPALSAGMAITTAAYPSFGDHDAQEPAPAKDPPPSGGPPARRESRRAAPRAATISAPHLFRSPGF
jgi:tRNA A-37 threonylcarbamoyl transferase component Bud32